MNRRLLYIIALLTLLGCAPKEDTTPSGADTDRLETLIDQQVKQIVDFKEQYGTYILYDFDKVLDFAYQFEQASNWNNARLTPITHDDAEGAVAMLYDHVFNCYSDSYKTTFFPRKLLLASDIASTNELGLSIPVGGHHTAVANINSVTFARMSSKDVTEAQKDETVMIDRCNEMHRALMADYMVKARDEYPVGEEFFAYSKSDYSTLMNNRRQTAAQLIKEDEHFFLDRGFFFPDDDESTYFAGAEDDVLSYIRHLIDMDSDTANELMDMPLMAAKMHLLAIGLQAMGVDVMRVNPCIEPFLTMEYVQPAVMYANDVVTDNPKATLEVTILRGSHALSHMVVLVNGEEQQTVDLSAYEKMKVVVPVSLDGLVKGANAVTLKLYEEGRDRVAATLTTGVSYATMDEVMGFTIKHSDENEDVFRRIKISVGDGGDVDNEQNPDLTTVAFEKHGWLDRNFMENEAEYRYWKMYRKNGRVATIVEYLQDGFNENYTAPLYRQTDTYTFLYNDEGELTEVRHAGEDNVESTIVNYVVYVAGRMVRYTYCGRVYDPVYATVNGVTTRVDCLDAEMSGLQFGFDGTEDLNPYYMPELPAVLPGSISEVPLQLLYSQYLFKSIDGIWKAGWRRDLKDKTNTATVTIDGVTYTYRFKLK